VFVPVQSPLAVVVPVAVASLAATPPVAALRAGVLVALGALFHRPLVLLGLFLPLSLLLLPSPLLLPALLLVPPAAAAAAAAAAGILFVAPLGLGGGSRRREVVAWGFLPLVPRLTGAPLGIAAFALAARRPGSGGQECRVCLVLRCPVSPNTHVGVGG
jgi:hypothetical protein